jgi:muramoyltetrapeptide carboxypeptidase
MNRKKFLMVSTAAGLAASVPHVLSYSRNIANPDLPIIKPKRLKEKNTIGLIAPAGFIKQEELDESIKNIESLGFNVLIGEHILERMGYFSGSDKMRAEEVNKMFANQTVSGIICARGGYGCNRILPFLDYTSIKNNPKPLIGYSDITSLICAIFHRTGLIGFHGPVGVSTYNAFSVKNFRDVLMEPKDELILWSAEENSNKSEYQVIPIRSGEAVGELVGGNLSVIVSLIGTEFDIETKNKIIFLEEVGEEPYRIDRMLTQMIQAGKFKSAAGIALGVFSKCEPKPDQSGITNSFSLPEVLYDRLFDLGIPVVYGLSFGHITNKFTLPCGIKARLDVDKKLIQLLEPAVI